MEDNREVHWALWRYGVLGPLVSARLRHGDVRDYVRQAASRVHVDPDGRAVKLSVRTIEAWFYAWRRGGLKALRRDQRIDRGNTHIREELQEKLVTLKREKPRRSIRRLIRTLERNGDAKCGELTKSSVQRFLKTHGLSGRCGRGEPVERRSFRHREAGELWMGDVLHGPRVIAEGRLRKSYLIAFIDSATRFVPAAELRLSEGAADHEYALRQAMLRHGLPRVLYLDNGAAQRSHSLRLILAELSVRLLHTEAYDPEAKGAIERWNRTFREEVEEELPEEPLPIDEVRSRIWSWLSVEYNSRVHATTGRIPREDWLSQASVLRSIPPSVDLAEVFLHREYRMVRRDGTVRFRGKFFEVRSSLLGRKVELRFDPFERDAVPRVFVNGQFVCDVVELDPETNAYKERHRPSGGPSPSTEPTGIDPLKLMQDEQIKRSTPPTSSDNTEDDHEDNV
jgi:transposase InsO family protein